MKKHQLIIIPALLLGSILAAQDKAEIKIRIIKDGEVVKDTSYTYDDITKAKHAIHMLDMMASDDIPMEKKHMKLMSMDDAGDKKIVFISEDGATHEIHGDGVKWVSSTACEDGDSAKTYIVKVKGDPQAHGNAYFFSDDDGDEKVIFNEDDGQVELIIKKIKKGDGTEKMEIHKEIIVIDEADAEKGEWTVKEGDDDKVIVIKKAGEDLKWTSKDGDIDENTEVIIIKKDGSDKDEKMEVEVKIDDNADTVKQKTGKKKQSK